MTGAGRKMAADTGVTEPKGHEESHRDGENIGRVTGDSQRRGQLLWVACATPSCSPAPSFYISLLPHTCLCLPLPHCFFSLAFPLYAARSTALLAPGNAVRSPLSLCDGGMAGGVKGRWSGGGLQHWENTLQLPSVAIFRCP